MLALKKNYIAKESRSCLKRTDWRVGIQIVIAADEGRGVRLSKSAKCKKKMDCLYIADTETKQKILKMNW
jgi:hypothetical protein